MRLRRARQYDARNIAEVHVRAWRGAYKGLVPDEILDGLSVEERERSWRELLSPQEGRSRDDGADESTAEIAATRTRGGGYA
jgi:hypothetical protein